MYHWWFTLLAKTFLLPVSGQVWLENGLVYLWK
nr:MAG TPA_asm: hypothetical protein [Bacteriophage sp.]DAR53674.1 MAG TPA: hypothetical protein [Caudoviricetes sp.]